MLKDGRCKERDRLPLDIYGGKWSPEPTVLNRCVPLSLSGSHRNLQGNAKDPPQSSRRKAPACEVLGTSSYVACVHMARHISYLYAILPGQMMEHEQSASTRPLAMPVCPAAAQPSISM